MKKYLLWIILFLIAAFFAWQIFLPKNSSLKEELIFNIEKGEGSRDIALNLEKEGLIRFAPIFRIYVLTVGVSDKLQVGKYGLSPSMSIYQMAKKFASGDVAKKIVTIPEGFTVKQIEEKLNITIDPALEGFLFPDTYHFSYTAASGEIVEIMRDNFEKKITRELKEEIEILASPEKVERIKDYKTLLEDRVLIDMPNVIVTPHIAFYSKEAEEEIIKMTADNIKGFISNVPINLVK